MRLSTVRLFVWRDEIDEGGDVTDGGQESVQKIVGGKGNRRRIDARMCAKARRIKQGTVDEQTDAVLVIEDQPENRYGAGGEIEQLLKPLTISKRQARNAKLSLFKVSAFGSLSTLCSAVAGIVFLDEPFSASLIIGGVLILVGVRLVTMPKKEERSPFENEEKVTEEVAVW